MKYYTREIFGGTMNYIIFSALIYIASAATVPNALYVTGKNKEKYNVAGYSSYSMYTSKVEAFLSEKLADTYSFALKYNGTNPAVLLSHSTPEKLVFLQLLHSFEKKSSDLNTFLFRLSQDFIITDSIKFRKWVDFSFNFPPTKILNMVEYIAAEKIQLTKNFTEQMLYLSERYNVFENAVSVGNNEVVSWLLENGLQLQTIGRVFERSWKNGQVETISLVMKHCDIKNLNIKKEIVNELFNNNETLLHIAVRFGFMDAVKYLVRNLEADINLKDVFGKTPLFRAIESNNSKIVELLIDLGADTYSDPSLKQAVANGDLETVKVLIKLRVVKDLKDNNGQNPLFLAVEQNNVGILDALALTHDGKENLNLKNDFGDTLMHIASSKGFIECVKRLQRLGVIDDSRNNYGQTPLYKAVENENLEVVRELIRSGADINTKTDLQDTLMHLTASKGNIEIAKLLIQHKIKTEELNSVDQVPFYKAAQYGKSEIMDLLLKEGTDILQLNHKGMSMLHQAAADGNELAVKMLITKGFFQNIDISGFWGVTPLHLAATYDHLRVTEVLLRNGANPNAQNKDLWTPMHRAALGGYDDIVKLLLRYKADPSLEDKDGNTPLQLAVNHGQHRVIALLNEYDISKRFSTD